MTQRLDADPRAVLHGKDNLTAVFCEYDISVLNRDRVPFIAFDLVLILFDGRRFDRNGIAGIRKNRVFAALRGVHGLADLHIITALGIDRVDRRTPGNGQILPCVAVKAELKRVVLYLELHGQIRAYIFSQSADRCNARSSRADLRIAQIPFKQSVIQDRRHAEMVPALADGQPIQRDLKALVLRDGLAVHGDRGMAVRDGGAWHNSAGQRFDLTARDRRQGAVGVLFDITDFGHGVVEVVKLVTAQLIQYFAGAVLQDQLIDVAASPLVSDGDNAQRPNLDSFSVLPGSRAVQGRAKGIDVRVAGEQRSGGQFRKKLCALSR